MFMYIQIGLGSILASTVHVPLMLHHIVKHPIKLANIIINVHLLWHMNVGSLIGTEHF